MKPPLASTNAAGEGKPSPAPQRPGQSSRTIANGILNDCRPTAFKHTDADRFNFGRHRWLGQVARDAKLPGAAHRLAIILWEKQNVHWGYAWPSLVYLSKELGMHKSTVIRSLRALQQRQWITSQRRGGRHRSNRYRIAFGTMANDDGTEDG